MTTTRLVADESVENGLYGRENQFQEEELYDPIDSIVSERPQNGSPRFRMTERPASEGNRIEKSTPKIHPSAVGLYALCCARRESFLARGMTVEAGLFDACLSRIESDYACSRFEPSAVDPDADRPRAD